MNRIIVFFAILSVSLSLSLSPVPGININDPIVFLNGLLAGLEQTPGSNAACVAKVGGLNLLIENVVVDIQGIMREDSSKVLALIVNLKAIEAKLPLLKIPCNVQALENTLKGLLTLAGFKALLTNLQDYEIVIKEDVSEMEYCFANLALCGENLGQIIKLALDWGI
jgi:hypothetical protein